MNPHPPHIVVLGAHGRFGHAVVCAFAQAGWRVMAQVRRQSPEPWPPGVEPTSLDLTAPQRWAERFAPVDWVVHALNPPYPLWAQEVLPLGEQSMAIAQALGARWLLPGNVYNFGASMPEQLSPTTPFAASTRKGRIRVALEARAQALCAQGRLRATVVRAGDFFGHGRGSWMDLVIARDWRKGKLVYPGARDVAHAWAYLPDLARTLVALAQRKAPLPDFENLHFAGHSVSGETLLDALQVAAVDATPEPPKRWQTSGMPWWLLRGAAWAVPMWREIVEMQYLWNLPHDLQADPWPPSWGPQPQQTGLATALSASLQAL